MPIPPELLNPVPGPNPGGVSLRYDPVYDKIKEARREDDEVPQGDWVHELKKADWPAVIKLCGDALATRSKDLQLAAWLTEAWVRREGFAGLLQGLELCRALLEQFWDELFPEIEDGELELRAAPLDWIGSRLDNTLRRVPLTRSGLDWFQYKQSRTVGYEGGADSDQKREAREQAVADGKLTAEEFDKAFAATPKQFYADGLTQTDACMNAVASLAQLCEARFDNFTPSFGDLTRTLEEIRATYKVLLNQKRETEPDEGEAVSAEESAAEPEAAEPVSSSGAAAAPARKKIAAGEPVDRADACDRVAALAAWLRKEDAYNPVAYLLPRALRWGELRAGGGDIDSGLLEAPSTGVRTQIKRLTQDGNYEEAIAAIEAAMAQPCGRGWLDLQRYLCTAFDNAGGYDAAKSAVIAELKALLADFPDLPRRMLLDDTPAANPETQEWLQTLFPAPEPAVEPEMGYAAESVQPSASPGEPAPPDAFELAKQAIRSGRAGEAIELLAREASFERSGRARFGRRVQLAQVCMAADRELMARPILEGLVEEIDHRGLEDWEAPEMLAHPLALLYRCMTKLKEEPEVKQKLYARICRLDPGEALELSK